MLGLNPRLSQHVLESATDTTQKALTWGCLAIFLLSLLLASSLVLVTYFWSAVFLKSLYTKGACPRDVHSWLYCAFLTGCLHVCLSASIYGIPVSRQHVSSWPMLVGSSQKDRPKGLEPWRVGPPSLDNYSGSMKTRAGIVTGLESLLS
jgi:hypothetical protein